MTLWKAAKEEFKKSPIATSATLLGLLGGSATAFAAWAWITGGSLDRTTFAAPPSGARNVFGPTTLLIIGIFLLTTPASAAISAHLYRFKKSLALFASILIASLTAFMNRLNASALGYPPGDSEAINAIEDLIFFGTIFIFVAIAGRAPLIDFFRPTFIDSNSSKKQPDGIAIFGSMALLIAIWGGIVAWAYNRLVAAFIG